MRISLIILFSGLTIIGNGQEPLESSNLPIICINTHGQKIDKKKKINTDLRIYNNDEGKRNYRFLDAPEYTGNLGIEFRGQSSFYLFPKKGYALETRDSLGEDLNVSLMSFPEENDWVLHNPYSDKTLIRNAFTYQCAAQIMSYAPRTKMCELMIDDEYLGVYLFTEKIKRDKNRVNISKLTQEDNDGDELTGGYILKFDKGDNDEIGWLSPFTPLDGEFRRTPFLINEPDIEDITGEQLLYIKGYITSMEKALLNEDFDDPDVGYRKYLDVSSAIDVILINEMTKNVDGYRLSTFMYKDRDSKHGKLSLGPVWDFNIALGNANYCQGGMYFGWGWDFNNVCPEDRYLVHFWWSRLLQDPWFVRQLKDRWQELRSDLWTNDNLFNRIDSLASLLDESQKRNFEKWDVIGKHIWPNNFVGRSYENEISYLKKWLTFRLEWLDENIEKLNSTPKNTGEVVSFIVSPNPTFRTAKFEVRTAIPAKVQLVLYDNTGRMIINPITLMEREENQYEYNYEHQIASGVYYFSILINGKDVHNNKLVVIPH